MAPPKTSRGNIVQILNELVKGNRIAGYRTNLFERPSPGRPTVTVLNRRGDDPKAVEQEVLQALAAASASIEVQVDGLKDLEG